MDSPQKPTPEQYEILEHAGALKMFASPYWTEAKDGVIKLSLDLPRQGVSLIRLTHP